MVIIGRVVLKDPHGSGRVEVMVAHNAQPGSKYEAQRAFERVRDMLVAAAEDAAGSITIETEGWAG